MFKNSAEISFGLLYSWPFTNDHCHLLHLIQHSRLFFFYVPTADAIVVLDVRSTVLKISAPFSDILHISALCVYEVAVNFDGVGAGGMSLLENGITLRTAFPQTGLQYRCHCTSTCPMNSMRLTLAPSVICYPYYRCCPLSENKMPY